MADFTADVGKAQQLSAKAGETVTVMKKDESGKRTFKLQEISFLSKCFYNIYGVVCDQITFAVIIHSI